MNKSHEVSFGGVWDLCCSSIDEEFWFEEGLVFIVVASLVVMTLQGRLVNQGGL